ncbi:hypothetical protein V6R85_01295 [Agrobacterium sp. CCNWLW32]|uniref:hypothetical protein n=1 Tax=Agrobacterium sp. CCNWLW32 TaxID=3122072 RepID=UPI0030104AF2
MTYVKVAVSYADLNEALVSRLKAAEAELIKVREEAQQEFLKSPKGVGTLAIDCQEYRKSSIQFNWPELTSTIPTHGFGLTVKVQEDFKSNRSQSLQIGEKTVNMLLSGKLLSEGEKKALLKRIGVDLDSLTETAGA